MRELIDKLGYLDFLCNVGTISEEDAININNLMLKYISSNITDSDKSAIERLYEKYGTKTFKI